MRALILSAAMALAFAPAANASCNGPECRITSSGSIGYYGVPASYGTTGTHTAPASYHSSPSHASTSHSSAPITYGHSSSSYSAPYSAPATYAHSPSYGHSTSYAPSSSYSSSSYAPASYAPATYAPVSYSPRADEVIVYEQRRRRKQSYYFNPRDYRSFKCKERHGTQKCSFDFRGKNADDVEHYLVQALTQAAGYAPTQTQCHQKRRGEKVTCSMRGDLRGVDTRRLRHALYGR